MDRIELKDIEDSYFVVECVEKSINFLAALSEFLQSKIPAGS